ncbi:ankyrin repeat-containing domain protein [Fennellomyces sp. T-0311]|nr:ankyrin repeat-containing domain protein [Fennellomyces sp. T-0311]
MTVSHPEPLVIPPPSVITQSDIYNIISSDVGCTSVQQRLKNAVESYATNWNTQYSALADSYDKLQMIRMDLEHELVIQQAHYDKAVREMKFYKYKYQHVRQKRQEINSPSSDVWEYDRKGHKPRRHLQHDTSYPYSLDDDSAPLTDADEQIDLMAILSVTDDEAHFTGGPRNLSVEKIGAQAPPPSHPPPPPPLTSAPSDSAQESRRSSSLDPSNEPDLSTHTRNMPLSFACGDGFWDTIARGKNNKVEVDTLISNYLRRGGQPNVAKNSSSLKSVKEGYGLIHALIAVKNSSALTQVIEAGANPNATSLSQDQVDCITPLVLAAQLGYLNGVRLLLERARADIFQRGPDQITALHAAIQKGADDVVVYLLRASKYALLDIVDIQGATPLHYACMHGRTRMMTIFIRDCHVKRDSRDNKGETPLHYAVRHRRLKIITRLVGDFGVYPNHYVAKQTPTPLDLAKSGGLKTIYEYLRGTGAKTTKEMERTANRFSSNTHSTTSGSGTNSAISSVSSGTIATPVRASYTSSTISGSTTTTTTTGSSARSVISSGSASILSSNESSLSRDSGSFTLSRASMSFRNTFFSN